MTTAAPSGKSSLVSTIISCILCLIIFASLRFYADWFNASQANIITGGFLGSWLFVFCLTAVSNIEMIVFGADFQAKFIPEILFSLTLAVVASGVVHRVCATTCVLFSIIGLYFVNRISTNYHNKTAQAVDQPPIRKNKMSRK